MVEGFLRVYVGPMFAKKSTEILREADRLGQMKISYRLFKPVFDDRYSENEVVTHDGVSLPCLSIAGPTLVEDHVEVVLIDEVQFFGIELVPWVRGLLRRGITVIAAGLDMDWKGEPFVVSGALAAMADRVYKMSARCSVCGFDARKTAKLAGNNRAIELGAADKYEARCNVHWHD